MKIIRTVLIMLLIPSVCFGLTATWTPSENADGYYLYVSKDGVENHWTIIHGQAFKFDFELPPGAYEISMSAYNQAGESLRSNIVLYTQPGYTVKPSDPPETIQPPEPPGGLSLIGQGLAMVWQGIKGLI